MTRTRPLLTIAGFALLFLFPALQGLTRWLPDAPLSEKRAPTAAPAWATRTDLTEYLLGWQHWFGDRYPGRNLLIRLETQIDYSIFGYSDRVHIGRDGWLFYRSLLDVEEPRVEAMDVGQLDGIVRDLQRLQQRLANRGVTLVVFDNELKDAFHPDALPASAPRGSARPRYAEFRRCLHGALGPAYVDASPILHDVARQRPAFYRTDFHWNEPAAFEIARALVDRMAAIAGAPRGFRFRLETEERLFSGGEAEFMPLFTPINERALFVRRTWEPRPAARAFGVGPFEYVHRLEAPTPEDLPPVTLFGDSFLDVLMSSGFEEHFVSVHRARLHHAPLEAVLAALPSGTRYFVFQFIATTTPTLPELLRRGLAAGDAAAATPPAQSPPR